MHRGRRTNKATSRGYAKIISSAPHHPITELPLPLPASTGPNAFSPPKKTHPLSRPKNQNSIPRRHGINIKVYSGIRRTPTNTPSTTSPLHPPSARRSTSRSTITRYVSPPPRPAKTGMENRPNHKPWCSCWRTSSVRSSYPPTGSRNPITR